MTLAKQWEQQGMQQGMQQGIEKGVIMGMEKGRMEGLEEVAKNLLYKGHSVAMVAEATKLPFDVVQQLSDEILVH